MDVDDPTAQSRQKADHGDEESHVADTHSWRKGTPDMMFNRMYASLGGSQGRVLFVRIDCTEASACTAELPDADTDSAFPVFRMYFSADIKYDYDRVMNYKNLLSFVLSMAYAEVHEYTTLEDAVDNIDTLRTADRVVVGFFATDDDANYKTWIRTANTWCADVDTAEVISADIAAAFGVTQLPAIMLMKRHQLERMAIPAGGALLAADLHRFFHRASHEHVAPLKSNTFSHIQLFNTPAVLLVLDPSLAMHDEMVARINAIADNEHYQHNYKFVEVDVTRHKSLAHQLGLAENLPRIAILDSTPTLDQYTHPDSGDSAIESLERFLEDFEHGKLTMAPAEPVPDLPPIPPKSSAPFELDRKLPVQEISRSQWDEVIVNSEYDIFIEFYYPWCGHCKALEPTFQQVGQFFGRTSDVMVAKMNMQDNEPPKELNIVGAPTLMLFTAGNKTQPLTYEGKRDYKKIRKWIVANLHPDNKFLQNPPPELEDVFDLDPRAKVFIDRIRDDVAHHGYAFPPVVLEDSNDAAKDEL